MENLKARDGLSVVNESNNSYYNPGDIIMTMSTTVPDGFLLCDGSTIIQSEHPALYSVLGTYYDPAGTVCKLPDLNKNYWYFPCCTVGNAVAYPYNTVTHNHSNYTGAKTSSSYSTAAHNHGGSSNSSDASLSHSHGAIGGSISSNVASTIANRSNGSGQGTNLAIYGHYHSWGANFNSDSVTYNHSHTTNVNFSSDATSHTHGATLTVTTNTSNEFVPDNVISVRYYIKY